MNVQRVPSFTGKYVLQGNIEDTDKVEKLCLNNKLDIYSLSAIRLKYGQDKCIDILATNEDSYTLRRAKRNKDNPVAIDKSKSLKENVIGILTRIFKENIGSIPFVKAKDVINLPEKRSQYRHFDFEEGHFYDTETHCLDGTEEHYSYLYDKNGRTGLKQRTAPNGTITGYSVKTGNVTFISYPDGTTKKFYETGELKEIINIDGTNKKFYENGKLKEEITPDGTRKKYYETGTLKEETKPDCTINQYYENGQLKEETTPDGTRKKYYETGELKSTQTPDGYYNSYYKDGNLKTIKTINK